jgi:hypothetical protein
MTKFIDNQKWEEEQVKHYSCCIVDALLVLGPSDSIFIYLVTEATIKNNQKAESEKENESIMILTFFCLSHKLSS